MKILSYGPIQMAMDMQIKLEQIYLMIAQMSLVHPRMIYAAALIRMAMVGLMNLTNIQTMLRSI